MRKEQDMVGTLIKIDKNGSKHYEGMVTCDRCGGAGASEAWKETGWTCWKCGGTGKVRGKWIERTPEYQAKLDARRQAKIAKIEAEQAKIDAERKAREAQEEAERLAEEARIKAQKAISQFVGEIGEKITFKGTYEYCAWYEVKVFYSMETRYIYTFKDEAGNVLIWRTSSSTAKHTFEEGQMVEVTGTVKEHSVYKDEKQTALIRCKIKEVI